MAQYRQPGVDRLGVHHHPYANGSSEHVSIGIRAHSSKPLRLRRSSKSRRISVGVVSLVLCFALILSVFAFDYFTREPKEIRRHNVEEDDVKDDSDFLANVSRTERSKVLKFGLGSVAHGRDSRYWDTDDRRRDEDYNEDLLEHGRPYAKEGLISDDHVPLNMKNSDGKLSSNDSHRNLDHKGVGLYNEAGRDELKMYEAAYEASLKNVGHAGKKIGGENLLSTNASVDGQHEAVDVDEYDDGIDLHDAHLEEDENIHDNDVDLNSVEAHNEKSSGTRDWEAVEEVENVSIHSTESSLYSSYSTTNSGGVKDVVNHSKGKFSSEMHSDPKRKLKRRKYAGCEIKFINSTAQLVEPLETRKFAQFFLQYKEVEEKPEELDKWEPRFAGHQTLQEREESFLARDHEINCGFVRGPEGFQGTGFDLAEDDARYTSTCHIAVVSCIFGNSDRLRTPTGKKVTRMSKKNVCFVMFMDETTLKTISLEGQVRDGTGFIGLWKIIVVKNLPYTDMRRVGKIPKLLSHRLFPSARYSIWLDSKLRLQLDPYFILDHFLWRKGYEYAISNHYDRHCIWEEVAQNKKLNKYNHTVIDQQFAFYRADGLKRFNASDPNKLLPSNVPEGSLIIRAHTPMSNLFSCLWFNEVERFTPRDQLSFAYTYQKLRRMNPAKPFHLNMFKDCERRAIAKLYHHRSEEKKVVPLQAQE